MCSVFLKCAATRAIKGISGNMCLKGLDLLWQSKEMRQVLSSRTLHRLGDSPASFCFLTVTGEVAFQKKSCASRSFASISKWNGAFGA